jgi:hypothetical protein
MGFWGYVKNNLLPAFVLAGGAMIALIGYGLDALAVAKGQWNPPTVEGLGALLFFLGVVALLYKNHQSTEARFAGLNAGEAQTPPPARVETPAKAEVPTPLPLETKLTAYSDALPETVSQKYLELMLSDHTTLQETAFLKPYDGEWIILEVEIAGLDRDGNRIRAQCRHSVGSKISYGIFAYFEEKWNTRLTHLKPGDKIRFKGKINAVKHGIPHFEDAVLV